MSRWVVGVMMLLIVILVTALLVVGVSKVTTELCMVLLSVYVWLLYGNGVCISVEGCEQAVYMSQPSVASAQWLRALWLTAWSVATSVLCAAGACAARSAGW